MGGDGNSAQSERLVSIVQNYEKRLSSMTDRIDRLTTRAVSVAEIAEAKTKQQAKKTILIVDEKYLTETLKIIFQIIGYQVDTAHNGIQALKKTLDKPYDLVIMEANLNDAGGFEMAQIIKNMSRKTKMVLMTGDEYWEDALRGAPAEVDDVLLKPFAPEELVNAVRRILEPRAKVENDKVPKLPFA
jgi:DNA-binding NtrC family response regulator